MLFSDALEVAIGLTFVFLLVSLMLTATLEAIESVLRTRGAHLLDGLRELLGDPAVAGSGDAAVAAVYAHPQVQGLYRGGYAQAAAEKRLPAYVPARNFALALLDQVLAGRVNAAPGNASLPAPAHAPIGDRLRLAAERVTNAPLRQALLQAAAVGRNDAERVLQHLQDWYDAAMDRVSGATKRRSQQMSFWLGLVAAVALNVNTLTIAESLSKNATLRRAVVAQVEKQAPSVDLAASAPQALQAQIDQLGLPLGWSGGAVTALVQPLHDRTPLGHALGGLQIGLGYLLTALATTLGAPFWFDMLNRLMVIRSTVKPREKSPEEGSEDRKPGDAPIRVVTGPAVAPAAAVVPLALRPLDHDIYAEPPRPGEKPFEDWD